MTKSLAQRVIAACLCALAIALIAIGAVGMSRRTSEEAEDLLSRMRTRGVLVITGEGAVESFVTAAKRAVAEEIRAAGGDIVAIRAASEEAEAEARANASASLLDYETADTATLSADLLTLRAAMAAYSQEEERAKAEYVAGLEASGQLPEATPEPAQEEMETLSDADGLDMGMGDDLLLEEEEPQVDLSGFTATAEMLRLQGEIDAVFEPVAKDLKDLYPALDDDALGQFRPLILELTHVGGDSYASEFDRYARNGGLDGVAGAGLQARIIRYGDDMMTIGAALILLALMITFYKPVVRAVGVPCLIIGGFFALLCVVALLNDLSLTKLMSDAVVRMGMNSVMVLAMVPAIQCGIGLNLGLPVGIMGGLLGGLLCIELGFTGWWGFLFAIAVGSAISAVFGYLYSILLNHLKGNEMAVTTYVGFSIVSLFCIVWLVIPFASLVLKWPLGQGLRMTVSMAPAFGKILDSFLAFKVGGITIPTGLLLFMGLSCFLIWMFTRSKSGVAMQAVGNNPRFAMATGINVDKMRTIGTMLSTILGAVGIIVYSQSFGYMQLYVAPQRLGLIAASAILIGGASTTRARISHVFIGTFLFHGVLTLGMPVANALVPGTTVAETLRIIISNGIILYALTKSGGGSRA